MQGGVEEYWKEMSEGGGQRGGVDGRISSGEVEENGREGRECERDAEEIPELGVGGGVLKEKSIGKERDAEELNNKCEVGGVLLIQKDAVNGAVEIKVIR